MRTRNWSKFGTMLVTLAATLAVSTAVWAGPAAAGGRPTATAEGTCEAGEGFILVDIFDTIGATYDIYIDGVLVDEDVTASNGDPYSYGPYDDGLHTVWVYWSTIVDDKPGFITILDTEVTLDCTSVPTTPSTTVAPSTTAAPTTTAVTAAVATPRFTG